MFCPKCGSILSEASVCPECGYAHSTNSQPNPTPAPTTTSTPAPDCAQKFCPYCGGKISADAVVCPLCNRRVVKAQPTTQPMTVQPMAQPVVYVQQPQYQPQPKTEEDNIFGILSLIMAFVFSPAGLVLGIIGMNKAKKLGGTGKGLSVAGFIISLVQIVAPIVGTVVGAVLSLLGFAGTVLSFLGTILEIFGGMLPYLEESAMLFI